MRTRQAALAYLAAWGLVGLAVTYYYDADDLQVRAGSLG